MQDQNNKKPLYLAVSSILAGVGAAAVSNFSIAQDDVNDPEEVVVTGIRASLDRAMDVKRNTTGVVDAISSEDIGKFPDSNLAESLQRITGVSINRVNGEGDEVSVRGFGGSNNLVLLNGRHMPAADAGGGGGSASRSFKFSNIASESVSAIEVYKTGRAEVATGGIGGTINIKTARPLDNAGFSLALGAKAVHDTTNRTGDDLTPELSGLVSWTDSNEMFGVLVSLSSQKRDFGNGGGEISNWSTGLWDSATETGVINNAPDDGDLVGIPSDFRYYSDDVKRDRTNGQLVLQFAPIDSLTATLDYTYSKTSWEMDRAQQSVWFTADDRTGYERTFSDGTVKVPVLYSESFAGSSNFTDLSFAQQRRRNDRENKSVGLNLDWQINDMFKMGFDYHDSEATDLPQDANRGMWHQFGTTAYVAESQTIDYSTDTPRMYIDVSDANLEGSNGTFGTEDMTTTRGQIQYASAESKIKQAKVDFSIDTDFGGIDFGIEARELNNQSRQRTNDVVFGNWNGATLGNVPDELFAPYNLSDRLDDLGDSYTGAMDSNMDQLIGYAEDRFNTTEDPLFFNFVAEDGTVLPADATQTGRFATDQLLSTNRSVKEETKTFFTQYKNGFSLFGKDSNVVAGFRYEQTDVTSSSALAEPLVVQWGSNDDYNVQLGDMKFYEGKGSYSHFLPSLDLDMEFIDGLKGRASYSKTIGRPGYDRLTAGVSGVSFGSRPQDRQAVSGDPSLKPLESNNFDISMEWYYGDSSYVSLGYFAKLTDNFVGSTIENQTVEDIRDPTAGPRAIEATEDLIDADINVSGEAVQNQIVANEGLPVDSDVYGDAGQGDPLAVFQVTVPENSDEGTIDGIEFAVQHVFGESGFGGQFNYTFVQTDKEYDITSQTNQFAIVGISDTANVIAFFEKYGFQARIAYNWRDSFLDTTTANGQNEPGYTEAYSQIDVNLNYDITDNFNVFVEGINIAGADSRRHGRTSSMFLQSEQLGARYQFGVRYSL